MYLLADVTGTGSDKAHERSEGGRVVAVSSAREKATAEDLEGGHQDAHDDVPRESAHHWRRIQHGRGARTIEAGAC